jgi:H+/Cl- antiporter ClcA
MGPCMSCITMKAISLDCLYINFFTNGLAFPLNNQLVITHALLWEVQIYVVGGYGFAIISKYFVWGFHKYIVNQKYSLKTH